MRSSKQPDNSKPRTLQLCKVYLPVNGGVQRVVHSITRLLEGYTHHIVTTGEDGAISHQRLNGIDITRCRSYLEIASMPIAPSLVKETLKQAKLSDIVCLHYPFPLADLALLLTIKLPPILVFWHSNIVAQKKLKWLIYPLIYFTLWRAAKIVVTSERMVENSMLLKRFKNKVAVIPYGIPPLTETPKKENAKRETTDEIIGKPYFLIVGRHVSYKGIDIAIEAIKNTSSQLVIAGDGPLYEQHKLLAQTLEIDHKVTFKKSICDDEITSLIKHCTALVVPSVMHNEAFALVQLEAMRLKKPVINTNLPSTVPLVARDQLEGLTVRARDSEQLADAMSTLSSNSELAAELGENGFDRFNSEFSDTQYRKALNSLFEDVLATK